MRWLWEWWCDFCWEWQQLPSRDRFLVFVALVILALFAIIYFAP